MSCGLDILPGTVTTTRGDGQFHFRWFDRVMDQLQAAGIKAILDIAVRPAPLRLHNQTSYD